MKFLFTTLPSNDLGLITRSLPIAVELRKRGHEVAFCSPGKSPQTWIREAGFDNLLPNHPPYYIVAGDVGKENWLRLLRSEHPVRDVRILATFLARRSALNTADIWSIDHFMNLFGMWNEDLVRSNVEALKKVIQTCRPDAVVDFWNPFACLAARACRVPLATVIQADIHPLSRGFIWWKGAHPPLIPSPLPATNAVLAEQRLPPVTGIGELLVGDLTLVVGTPETDPLPESADVHYVGPILWEKEDMPLPGFFADLNPSQPIVWLYPGNMRYLNGSHTSFDSAEVLRAGIEALRHMNVQVVVTTGHHPIPVEFLPLPANFHHAAYAPGLALAEKCDLLIHHGGYGSCQTGLAAGKPALIIPTYSERESNARRIAALGAGDFILPATDPDGLGKHVDASALRERVFSMLANPSYLEKSREMREKLRGYGGAADAARRIEGFVGA